MREMRTLGINVAVELKVYDTNKYELKGMKTPKTVTYKDVKYWEIVTGDDALEIEAMTDGSCIDDNHEYLVLTFANGESATFRNSYVDMFRI